MAMDFWAAKRRARKRTALYVFLFVLLTGVVAVGTEFALRTIDPENYNPPMPIMGGIFLGLTLLVAGYNYMMYKQFGGAYVAESVNAWPLNPDTRNFKERQLLNIVEETAIASSLPVPPVYIIPANEINAFAAGMHPDNAVIAITEGALDRLNRDEVQAVIAHEFGHIANADMVLGLRLAAMVMGFFFVMYLGIRLMQFGPNGRDREGRGNVIPLIAIVLMIAGTITWFAGKILQAAVSRQREYLADASSVQYTRNPDGMIGALKKIGKEQAHDMPKEGSAYSHMYFEGTSSLFATHPPIEKRIAAIEGREE